MTTAKILGPIGMKAIEGRGLNPETAVRFGLYTARSENGEVVPDVNGNIVVFPFEEHGVTVNEKYRAPGKKFWQSKGGKKTFFNADALDDPALEDGRMALVVTEGEVDMLTAIDCGFPLAVSVPDGAPPAVDRDGRVEDRRDLLAVGHRPLDDGRVVRQFRRNLARRREDDDRLSGLALRRREEPRKVTHHAKRRGAAGTAEPRRKVAHDPDVPLRLPGRIRAAGKAAGAKPEEIIAKELSIAGVQRPMSIDELEGFVEFFRFGDFAGFVWERPNV